MILVDVINAAVFEILMDIPDALDVFNTIWVNSLKP
jgi:hypothetical protein